MEEITKILKEILKQLKLQNKIKLFEIDVYHNDNFTSRYTDEFVENKLKKLKEEV